MVVISVCDCFASESFTIGGSFSDIIDLFYDKEGELVRSWGVGLLLLIRFTFKILKLLISIRDSRLTDVSEIWLILIYILQG